MSFVSEHHFEDEAIVSGELQLFRTLWLTSSDNLFIVKQEADGSYICEKGNPALERTFGLQPSQIDNVPITTLLNETAYHNIADRYDECIAKKIPITYEECHILDAEGERYWITTILPVLESENGGRRILGISREVTAIRNAEKALKKINEHLEREVDERTKALTLALKEMEKLSVTDKLTSLYNRYKIDELLESTCKHSERYNTFFGILMLDIDHFKYINDRYGHHGGDSVLQEFAGIMKRCARESDHIGRWGGEEFLILILESSKAAVLQFACRLKEAVEEHRFDRVGSITVSIGATLYRKNETPQNIVSRADEALYCSKNGGRNRVSYI